MQRQKKKIKGTPVKLLFILGLLLVAALGLSACGTAGEEAAATPAPPDPAEEVVVAPTTEIMDVEETVEPSTEVAGEDEVVTAPTAEVTEEAMATPGMDATTMETVQAALRASEVIGYQVKNFQGENLGEVEDVIVGLNQNPDYAILSFGGFLDIGDKLFAIPLSITTANTEDDTLFFNITEQNLENAPGFTDDAWPDVVNATWDDDILEFWGTTHEATLMTESEGMAETTSNGPAALRASELIGNEVRDAAGEDVGEVEDVIVNLEPEAEVDRGADYAILSFGGFADIGDQLLIVPLRHLDLTAPEEDTITFNVDEAALQNAPSFTDDDWPDLTDPTWDDDAFTFWDNNAVAPGTANSAGSEVMTDTTTTAPPAQGAADAANNAAVTNVNEPALRASQLLGYQIWNTQGEEIGEIEDLIVGATSERVRYAIVSFGGFADLGDDLYALPLSSMALDIENEALVTNIDETQLENAPGFASNAWPDLTDSTWDDELLNFWGSSDLQDEAALRVSEFMNYTLVDSQGQDLGEIEDLMVGLQSGRITYAVLAFGGFLDMGETVFAIPLNVLTFSNIDRTDQTLAIDIDQETIQNAPNFNPNTWPDASDPRWDDDVTNYWEANAVATGPKAFRASNLIGYNVINSQGEDLGQVEDLMIGLNSGRVKYAVLSFGGFLNLGEKLFAVPLSSMQFSLDDEALIFDVSPERLEDAPGFDNDSWPDMANPQWDLNIGTYWQNPDVANEAGIRASELLGYNIQNFQQEDSGEIEDLLVSLNNGQINYAIVSFGGFLELGDTLFAIPWQAMNFSNVDRENGVLTFEVNVQTLQNAPGFNQETWPDTATPGWDDDFYNFWNRARAE